MATAQFASLNGTAAYAATVEDDDFDLNFNPNPNAIARRSISIFSRRGTETPEPTPPFIAQAAMPKNSRPKKGMSEKQKGWIGRAKSISGGSSPSKPSLPKGTILNAVPPAKTIKMTALEEEMATSPNEEILSAVSEQSSSHAAFPPRLHSNSVASIGSAFWSKSSTSMANRTLSEKKKRDTNNRIGLWVNGVTQWDDTLQTRAHDHHRWVEEAITEKTGLVPLHAAPTVVSDATGDSHHKPRLSVWIPDGEEIKANTLALSTIVQPYPRKSIVSVAPASIVSKFNVNTPTITIDEPRSEQNVSPFESIQHTPPPQDDELVKHITDRAASEASARLRPKTSSGSSGSSRSSLRDNGSEEESSVRSNRSSATSIDALPVAIPKRSSKRLSGRALSSAPRAAIFLPPRTGEVALNKPLPPCPIPIPSRAAPTVPDRSVATSTVRRTSASSAKMASGSRTLLAQPYNSRLLKTKSLSGLDELDTDFARTSPYAQQEQTLSPTLSQAEDELHAQLSGITDNALSSDVDDEMSQRQRPGKSAAQPSKSGSIRRNDSVRSVMHPPERAPTLPKRSRKREWKASRTRQSIPAAQPARRKSDSGAHSAPKENTDEDNRVASVRRSVSAAQFHSLPLLVQLQAPDAHDEPPPPHSRLVIDDGLIVVHGPITIRASYEEQQALTVAAAEDVLLRILSSLQSPEDLFKTATINKGMYRVFKENEMQLIRTVNFNHSPAAWEMREWSRPESSESSSSKASSQLEHTPLSYMRCHRRDLNVIEGLKALILQHCQTSIRAETMLALARPSHPQAQRFTDAFWRIWCFCTIFGCEKGREDDVTGQLDWLKGGLLADSQGCVATVLNLDFEMGSVLLNAPEFFARGNEGGLSAQQLYDMTELWTCFAALLYGYQGRIHQARAAGVFDRCEDLDDGDIEHEEHLLEEWLHHILTLGPAVVLEMAEYALDGTNAGFTLANLNGWTKWTPPRYNGSRSTFLKEPVSRLYEERIASAARAMHNPQEQEKKETSRQRVASLAKEIRLKRQTSSYRRSPYIDMSMERPMSMLSRHNSTMSSRSNRSIVSPLSATQYTSPVAMTPTTPTTTPNFSKPQPHARRGPGHPYSHARKISPIIEERVVNFNRMSLQNFAAGEAEDTSELAVRKIVEMGFSAEQGRMALRMTDMGDGLRVDRAVDLLLRQRV